MQYIESGGKNMNWLKSKMQNGLFAYTLTAIVWAAMLWIGLSEILKP